MGVTGKIMSVSTGGLIKFRSNRESNAKANREQAEAARITAEAAARSADAQIGAIINGQAAQRHGRVRWPGKMRIPGRPLLAPVNPGFSSVGVQGAGVACRPCARRGTGANVVHINDFSVVCIHHHGQVARHRRSLTTHGRAGMRIVEDQDPGQLLRHRLGVGRFCRSIPMSSLV